MSVIDTKGFFACKGSVKALPLKCLLQLIDLIRFHKFSEHRVQLSLLLVALPCN